MLQREQAVLPRFRDPEYECIENPSNSGNGETMSTDSSGKRGADAVVQLDQCATGSTAH